MTLEATCPFLELIPDTAYEGRSHREKDARDLKY
jgi:hypothetical protein